MKNSRTSFQCSFIYILYIHKLYTHRVGKLFQHLKYDREQRYWRMTAVYEVFV